MKINLELIVNEYQHEIPDWINVKIGDNCLILKIHQGIINKEFNLQFKGFREGDIRFTTKLGMIGWLLPFFKNKIPGFINIAGNEISISLYKLAGEDFSTIIDALEFNNMWIEEGFLHID